MTTHRNHLPSGQLSRDMDKVINHYKQDNINRYAIKKKRQVITSFLNYFNHGGNGMDFFYTDVSSNKFIFRITNF